MQLARWDTFEATLGLQRQFRGYIGGFERLIVVVAILSVAVYGTRMLVLRKTNGAVSKNGPAEL